MVFFSASESSSRRKNHQCVCFSASDECGSDIESESSELTRKRKVVEHIFLLKAKGDLSDEEEKDMLDYLYTTQYQMSGIMALSLGHLSNQNPDGYTHAVYMRFQRREGLVKFYSNSFCLGVLKDHVMPYCHGVLFVDYESEVEDGILAIFRKGQEFNYGVEFMLLLSVVGSAHGERIENAGCSCKSGERISILDCTVNSRLFRRENGSETLIIQGNIAEAKQTRQPGGWLLTMLSSNV